MPQLIEHLEEDCGEIYWPQNQHSVMVSRYRTGEYDGEGKALFYCHKDKTVYFYDLGHCSCYGPLCQQNIYESYDIERFRDYVNSCNDTEMLEKFWKLYDELMWMLYKS